MVKKILDYILSAIYLLYFGVLMLIFHVIQIIAYYIFGAKAQQKAVEIFNFFIVYGFLITGSTARLNQKTDLPTNRTIIFICNHQSMFDIPGMIWFLRKHTPKFVAKKELGKGIPGISINLRLGKAALIDRKDSKQAIAEIIRFAKHISENTFSAVIFPEGTRSRTGKLKPFAVGGVATLLKKTSNPLIVPVAIKNSAQFNPKGLFPLTSFSQMSWNTLEPIEPQNMEVETLVKQCEIQISNFLGQEVVS